MSQERVPAPRSPQKRQRLRDDSGTALTEFVIVMPLFVLLLFWAEFLSDFGLVKLKVEEAARYAQWEVAAQRPQNTITQEIQTRFADLSSPSDITGSTPIGVRSFKRVNVQAPIYVTNIDAPFEGTVQLNWGGGLGGFIGRMISGLGQFIGHTVDNLVKTFHFETHREVQATVSFQVDNTLFPGGQLFYAQLDPERATHLTVTATSPVMLVDTWKAWPGPWAAGSQDTSTDVYKTYATNGSSAPEDEVSTRLKRLAFFNLLNNLGGSILKGAFTITGFMDPFSTNTWKNNSGPVVMLPGDNARHSWVPGSGLGSQLLGSDHLFPQSTGAQKLGDSPEAGTDRARSTVPGQLHTGFWHTDGGGANVTAYNFTARTNPYQAEYQCRDAYYLGSMVPQITRYKNRNANKTAFPSCQ